MLNLGSWVVMRLLDVNGFDVGIYDAVRFDQVLDLHVGGQAT